MIDLLENLSNKANRQPTKQPRWHPYRIHEQPKPAYVDPTMAQKEANALGAVYQLGVDSRKPKKTIERRTVEYAGSLAAWNKERRSISTAYPNQFLRPGLDHIVELRPPEAYSNPATSIAAKFVQASVNKIKCSINVVAWTPDGRRLLTGCHSGEFVLWNGLTFNFETILQAHDSSIRALAYTYSGDWIISADSAGTLKYFNPAMNNVAAWQAHGNKDTGMDTAIRGVAVSPTDQHFVTASDDQTLKVWAFGERREERTLTGHGWDVKCVDWHPHKGLIMSGGKDNLVKFWDPRRESDLTTLHGHKNTVQTCRFSPDGLLAATGSRDQSVRVFDLRAMKDLAVLKGFEREVCSLAWHPIHPMLVTGTATGAMVYHSLAHPHDAKSTINPIASVDWAHESSVWSMAWHPLGHLMASGSNDYTTRFWERERPGRAVGRDKFHLGPMTEDEEKELLQGPTISPNVSKTDDEDLPLPGLGNTNTGIKSIYAVGPIEGPLPGFDG